MNLIPFEKLEASGNDFILFDCMEFEIVDLHDQKLMEHLCDRRFGIGADGVLAVYPHPSFDFEMKYLNSDGRFSSFCGNGSRAISLYCAEKFAKKELNFLARDGAHSSVIENNLVSVRMKNLSDFQDHPLGFFVDTGSPHLIQEVDHPESYNVVLEGRQLRQKFSQEGTNVNFIQLNEEGLFIRTYERGVEDETLACGTGITAAAYYFAIRNHKQGEVNVKVKSRGGDLTVSMIMDGRSAQQVILKGPAHRVFSGFIDVEKLKI